jgi:hypothetical protein
MWFEAVVCLFPASELVVSGHLPGADDGDQDRPVVIIANHQVRDFARPG